MDTSAATPASQAPASLAPDDQSLLHLWFTSDDPITAICLEHNLSLRQIAAWAKRPDIAEIIATLRELHEERAKLQLTLAAHEAIITLKFITTTESPTNAQEIARRAAEGILSRCHHLRPRWSRAVVNNPPATPPPPPQHHPKPLPSKSAAPGQSRWPPSITTHRNFKSPSAPPEQQSTPHPTTSYAWPRAAAKLRPWPQSNVPPGLKPTCLPAASVSTPATRSTPATHSTPTAPTTLVTTYRGVPRPRETSPTHQFNPTHLAPSRPLRPHSAASKIDRETAARPRPRSSLPVPQHHQVVRNLSATTQRQPILAAPSQE